MSFYVTLPSHANRREFPNNQANSFKIRLPQPLRLQGGSWQVGLSAISLPDTHVNLYELVQKDGFIMSTSWDQDYPKPGGSVGEMTSRGGTAETLINDIQHLDWVVDGVSFMKATIAHLEQQRKETAIQGGRFSNDQGKHMYVKFKWEGEDLLIDNTNICHCKTDTPALYIYTKLAVKMGWLRKISSGLILGPNLQQDFMGDQIPNMTKPRRQRLERCERRSAQPGLLDGAFFFTGSFTIEYELWLAIHQLECSVSFGGGRSLAIVARVLGRGRQYDGRQSRHRFIARNPLQAGRQRHHVL